MKIATYFQPVWNFRLEDDMALLNLWEQSWSRHGWEPVRLGFEDATAHPDYERFVKAVREYPTVNDRQWEMTCFVRHLAYALSGVSVFSDYDIINYGWHPDLMDIRFQAQVHAFAGPGLFAANKSGMDWLLQMMMNWQWPELDGGRLHVSDQTVFNNSPISRSWDAINYGDEGWESCRLVHYGNATFGNEKRAERIHLTRPLLPRSC